MKYRVKIVPVGEYHVSDDIKEELLTVVASCAALVLYDAQNHIAGMVHIVLPGRRKNSRHKDESAYFADTGVPLLINSMLERGAVKNNLKAAIAGGGTIIADSAGLDIGIRNVEAVTGILEKEGIPIEKKDTGGRKGRRVRVRVDTGRIFIQHFSQGEPEIQASNKSSFSREDLRPLISRLEMLKPNSSFSAALIKALHKDIKEIKWEQIFMMISRDLPLAMHVFRIANSPYYGIPGEIGTFETALNMLGPVQFRRICMLASIIRQSRSPVCNRKIAKNMLSQHSLASALIARHIAVLKDMPYLFQRYAFTAGLFHGIGGLGNMLLDLDGSPHISYNKLGGLILSEFRMPEAVIAAVISHKSPGPGPSLASFAHMGCALSRMLGITTCLEPGIFKISSDIPDGQNLLNQLSCMMPDIFKMLKSNGLLDFFNLDEIF